VFYRAFIDAEIEGAGDKGSVDSTMIDVESLMGAFFENVCEIHSHASLNDTDKFREMH
jgi:hypothetical protein